MGWVPAKVFREKESKDMTEGIHLDENPMEALASRRKFLAGSAALAGGGADDDTRCS
jgi:hypothetical protein